MLERSSKPKRSREMSQRAKLIVDIATGAAKDNDKCGHEEERQQNGRLGAQSRARKLTPRGRLEIARKAAIVRWNNTT